MTTIRPFSERDIPEVVALYEREIRSGASAPPPRLAEYFRRTFLEHPWIDPEIPSLVSESPEGRVVGFLGSHVRRFRFDGRPIRLACSGQLVTDPAVRHQAAGAFLLRDYLAGPQEVTITDGANEPARRLWEGLGGDTLHVNCIDWIRVFRPVALGLEYATRNRGAGPVTAFAPALGARIRRGRRSKRLSGTVEELTPEVLVESLQELAPAFRLYPDYDVAFVEWLFREMAAVRTRGRLLRSLVRSGDGRVVGWYVAYLRKGGVSDVVQVAATGRTAGIVLDHLFREAAEQGASAVRGRLQSRLLPALSIRSRFLRYAGGALAHSHSDEILQVLRSNDSLLTRMDGEWWMGHHLEPFDEAERDGVPRPLRGYAGRREKFLKEPEGRPTLQAEERGEKPGPREVAAPGGAFEIEFVDDVAQLAEHWNELAAASGNLFSTPEWNLLWWEYFGRDRRLFVGVCRNGAGAIAAIVPLYLWRGRPVRVLRFLGHGHGDLLGPVCARDDPETAVQALRLALDRVRFDVFVGDWLLADEDWSAALGGRILRESGYPILRFEVDSWEEYLAALGRRFRKSIRSEHRKLEREHDVRFRLADEETLERDLDALFALHEARFQEHEGCYFCGSNEPFQRAFAARALERGWLRLCVLEVDGAPVSVEHGFRFGGAYFAYQVGRDPAWDRASVGSVLEAHTIRMALEEGVREYRFLLGNEPYKYRFATEDPELETIGVHGSSLGRLAISGVAALRGLRPFAAIAKRAASG